MKSDKKSKINPFNYHIQREKFSVLGKDPHKHKARPGQSREHAIELRKNTLLKEYQARNRSKSGYLKDRRIGENDPTIDAEKKTMLRFVASKKKEAKRAMYNLNDDEVLTHKGEPLNNENMQDVADFSDEEQSDDEGGNIDGEYVKAQHFGGGLFSRSKADDDKPKTKKEWIDEIIAESKKKKLAAKEEKTMQEEAVAEINEVYSSFLKAKSAQMMTREDKDEEKKKCAFSSYDKIYLELLTQDSAARANPTNRLKTDEEIEAEQKEKKRVHEIDRKKRMRNAFEQHEDLAISQSVTESADALGQCFKINEPVEEEKQPSPEKSKKVVYSFVNEQTEDIKKKEKPRKKTTKKKFPKNFEVSDDFNEFWEFFEGYSPVDVSGIITKVIENYHPTTGKPYEKCCGIFAFLLKVLDKLSQPEAESLSNEASAIAYCEVIMPGLFQLVHLSPATAASTLNDILMKKFSLFSKTGYKKYPFTDTFIFLRVACILFPASDFEHDVLTPALVFLTTMIGYGKVKSKSDIAALLFSGNLLFEYCKPSGRFVPELIWGLKSLLFLAIPKSSAKDLLSPICVGAKADMLVLSKNKKRYDTASKLQFSLINDTSDDINNKLKMVIIAETLTLLGKVIHMYSELSIAKVVFQNIKEYVSLLPTDKYPAHIKSLKDGIVSAILKLSGPGVQLTLKKARAQAITFYEPRIEIVRDSKWKKDNPQQEEQRLKLIHKRERKATKREIKKDFQFVANIRLKETIERDTERKRKYNTIMRELGTQEGEFQKYKKMKR